MWGNACNVAARIESVAINGTIFVSKDVRDLLVRAPFRYDLKRHRVTMKGYGRVTVFELEPRERKEDDEQKENDESG